ncbi:thiamine pyrophosphate-binding protein [Micromonospora parathelypteridis]|uniref:Thiamine pyrophosphate-dependent acetolactate synthase large subunit-like protein n=1 Tax=Micromonospora parathelypteridis TaxID=1839617 RepID=A0A840W713_9ACTN|nr:thiamine pyrophosphate-binding protein [Micromonospora parathelypteridis]MBB5480848.1 thiamine pyrophosphate-dependent acetolactate synthase large subunit-like protein [Micromonospora parathelypteridis]GGO21315.1 acetolactate synthase I/II/III large subunit [Micromonospora parathelypteridis]
MRVAEVVGRVLHGHGARYVFGVVGSGNFHVTNALVAAGARFVAAAHEGGAASMADGYARTSGTVGLLSVHQGPGVTNALTGLTEAAKSRTPMVVLAPEATAPRSNFFIDLPALATSVGADFHRIRATHAAEDAGAAYRAAARGATVVLGLPLEVQSAVTEPWSGPAPAVAPTSATAGQVEPLLAALRAARRPVFIAGRGARAAREPLTRLADSCGALLAVSAAAKGLFAGNPWNLDVAGGFATPLAAELIGAADLVVAWGSTLNMWTTRHGELIPPSAVVVQVDHDPAAFGVNRPVDLTVAGEVAAVADAVLARLSAGSTGAVDAGTGGWRTPELAQRIRDHGRWRTVPYRDEGGSARAGAPATVDPRTLSAALDDLLPPDRTVVVDSGNFMGYPSMWLDVPDVAGFCFTQAFQSIGLGLASALGAAVARPDRLTVAAVGDGGFVMSATELVTAVRLALPLLVVIYDDAAYGAEVHHFGPDGHPLDTVTFPETDLAAIARGYGCDGLTVRTVDDLEPVRRWLAGPRTRPLVIDAKVCAARGSWWLEEAFRGH